MIKPHEIIAYILLLSSTLFLFWPTALDPYLEIQWCGLSVVGLVGWLLLLLRPATFHYKLSLTHALFFLSLIIWGASAIISTSTAISKSESLFTSLRLLVFINIAIILLLLKMRSPAGFGRGIRIAGFTSTWLLGITMLMEILAPGFLQFSPVLGPGSLIGNRNLACALLFLTSATWLPWLTHQKRLPQFASLLSIILITYLCGICQTRSVWLAAVIAGIFWMGTWIKNRAAIQFKPPVLFGTAVVAGAVCVMIQSFFAPPDFFTPIQQVIQTSFTQADTSAQDRITIYKTGIELVQKYPITGVGSGNWKIAVWNSSLTRNRSDETHGVPSFVHNDFLQAWVEYGPLGVIALLMLIALGGLSGLGKSASLRTRITSAILTGFIAVIFLDYPLQRPATFIWWLLLVCTIIPEPPVISRQYPRQLPGMPFYMMLTIGFMICLGSAILFFFRLDADIKVAKGVTAFRRNDFSSAVTHLKQVNTGIYPVDAMGISPLYYLGSSLVSQGSAQGYSVLLRAKKDTPFNADLLNNIALCDFHQGDTMAAIKQTEQALALDPNNATIRLNRAILRLVMKDNTGACEDLRIIRKASRYPGRFDQISTLLPDCD